VVIRREHVDAIIAHARDGFPNEVCGVLAARNGAVVEVLPVRNADESPVTYRMDPSEQLQAMNRVDDEGWDLCAVYHSHTRTRAYPSETDVRLAVYPEQLYVIASLADPDLPDIRAFHIEEGRISEEEIEILD
jgi:[CysO sulfur-carrier protein]-S-L-cysteine hydrolase